MQKLKWSGANSSIFTASYECKTFWLCREFFLCAQAFFSRLMKCRSASKNQVQDLEDRVKMMHTKSKLKDVTWTFHSKVLVGKIRTQAFCGHILLFFTKGFHRFSYVSYSDESKCTSTLAHWTVGQASKSDFLGPICWLLKWWGCSVIEFVFDIKSFYLAIQTF